MKNKKGINADNQIQNASHLLTPSPTDFLQKRICYRLLADERGNIHHRRRMCHLRGKKILYRSHSFLKSLHPLVLEGLHASQQGTSSMLVNAR